MSTLPHFEALGAALAGNRHSAVIYARADGGIGFWNAGAEALFGHSPEEAMGKGVDLVGPGEISGNAPGPGSRGRSARRGEGAMAGVRSKACTERRVRCA